MIGDNDVETAIPDVETAPPGEPAVTVPLSFSTWYRDEYSQVVGLLFALTGSRWSAEELAQDAFVEAHKRWATISGYDDPGAWVRKVAVNKARSWGRRKGAEARAYARHMVRERPLPFELPESAERFWATVRSLPERQGAIVALFYYEDRSVDYIAALLGVHPGTVKTQLHRARAQLAAQLGAEDRDEVAAEAPDATEDIRVERIDRKGDR